MSHDGNERKSDKAAEQSSDARLRAILGSYRVPEPSKDFVNHTMLKIQMDQHVTPEPSAGFVDRVVSAWANEQKVGSDIEAVSEELVPVIDLSRHNAVEISAVEVSAPHLTANAMGVRRAASRFPMALALAGFAAALVLAFFIGRQSASSAAFSDEALVSIDDFPARGSNRFARSLSLVVDHVDSRLESERFVSSQDGPAYPRPVLSLPAPPSNLIPSAAVRIHVDQATLESLGMTLEQL